MEFLVRKAGAIRAVIVAICVLVAALATWRSGTPDDIAEFRRITDPTLASATTRLREVALLSERLAVAATAGAGLFDATATAERQNDGTWLVKGPAGSQRQAATVIRAPAGTRTSDVPPAVLSLGLVLDRIHPLTDAADARILLATPDGWQAASNAAEGLADLDLQWKEMQQSWAAGARRHWWFDSGTGLLVATSPVRQGGRLVAATVAAVPADRMVDQIAIPTGTAILLTVSRKAVALALPDRQISGPETATALARELDMPADEVLAALSDPGAEIRRIGDLLAATRGNAGSPVRVAMIGRPATAQAFDIDTGVAVLLAVIGVLGLTLLVSGFAARREIIRPAQSLIAHIEAENRNVADGIPPGVPESWRPWFTTISRIFEENRSLVRHLTETLENLDNAVDERTRELQQKNRELEAALGKLREAQDQIISQEKLASLGALTAGIAHEIKNPLNFVTNFAQSSVELAGELEEMLAPSLDGLPEGDRAEITGIIADLRDNAGRIDNHGKRADSIVKSMLAHARESSGKPEQVDLNALVRESANLAFHGKRAQDKGFDVTMNYELGADPAQVSVVPQEINRVVLNLVGNAFDAVRDRAAKTKDGFKGAVTVSSANVSGGIELVIADNGTGIAREVREKLFTPFFTTKATGSGTGLGLSICHDIVRRHNGRITVDSTPGDGARFTIWLPTGQ
jgi:signal transduction histidine kinase